MIIMAILLSIAAIGVCCWLLFTLAVFALPLFVGVTVGSFAYQTGAGLPGAILVGLAAAGLTLGLGQIVLGSAGPPWLRVVTVLAFVGPAAIAGYHATHGIVIHTMPSAIWQAVFSIIGAIAVGTSAFVRVAGMKAARPRSRNLARN